MTREELEAKLRAVREFYAPLIADAATALQKAQANADTIAQTAFEVEFELRAYFEAFEKKDAAQQIIDRGEPKPREPVLIDIRQVEAEQGTGR